VIFPCEGYRYENESGDGYEGVSESGCINEGGREANGKVPKRRVL
jgi:hypothetical protein